VTCFPHNVSVTGLTGADMGRDGAFKGASGSCGIDIAATQEIPKSAMTAPDVMAFKSSSLICGS
jgi:hypothetical protein